MKKQTKKILVSLGVMAVCIGIILGLRILSVKDQNDPFQPISRRVKGSPSAPIKIVEYVDYRCGPCGYGSRWLNDFMDKNPGKIFLEMRYYPLHVNYGALTARFAECALKQQKFWEVHDALFQDQGKWIRMSDPKDFFLTIAQQQGLDTQELQACWDDKDLYDQVMQVKHGGKELGVNATPTFFINGKMVVGARNLSEEIDALMNPEGKE